ncbi:MAG TPA: acyltransferase [Acidimicrobiales bacterium]|nr:acyltransferase [Acidimicrobiales bacterium]
MAGRPFERADVSGRAGPGRAEAAVAEAGGDPGTRTPTTTPLLPAGTPATTPAPTTSGTPATIPSPPAGTPARPAAGEPGTGARAHEGAATAAPAGTPATAAPAAALTTPAAPDHLAALDGLRAVAVLAVLAYHILPDLPAVRSHVWDVVVHLNIGVQIFFVLSGFLIYSPFARSHLSGTPGPGLRSYARRRVLRIYPAYLAAFGLLWAAGVIKASSGRALLSHLTLTQMYVDGPRGVGIGPAWSLVVEVSFYLFVPVWALAVRLTTRWLGQAARWRAELAGAAALIATGLVANWFTSYGQVARPLLVLPPALPGLGCGMVLAILHAGRRADPGLDRALARLPRAGWFWIAALAAFAVETTRGYDLLWATPDQRFWAAVWQPLVSVLLVAPIVLVAARPGLPGRVASWAPLASIGLVSYGTYLWQEATVNRVDQSGGVVWSIVDALFIVAVTVALGAASYLLIERPLLRRSGRRRRASDVAVTAL